MARDVVVSVGERYLTPKEQEYLMAALRRGSKLVAELPASGDEVGIVERLRAASIEAGNAAGGYVSDQVSNEFLLKVSGQVKLFVERLERETAEAHSTLRCVKKLRERLAARLEKVEAENERLRAALKPFAAYADWAETNEWPAHFAEDGSAPVLGRGDEYGQIHGEVTVADFCHARDLLKSAEVAA